MDSADGPPVERLVGQSIADRLSVTTRLQTHQQEIELIV